MSIEEGDRAMAQGSRYPKLRLKPGDRTRMHFLTNGRDDHIAASQFHVFGEWGEGQQRTVLCIRALTEGEESCNYCEEGHDNLKNRFGVWVYVHFILHPFDNPDEEAESWKTVEIEIEVGGEKKKRNLFREPIEQPLLLELAAGKSWVWWKQFVAAYANHGNDLQSHLYELHRIGEKLDTEYVLTAEKKLVIKAEHAEHQNNVPDVKTIFRETIRFGPSTSLAPTGLGTDQLEEGGDSPDGAAAEMAVPAATESSNEHDELL